MSRAPSRRLRTGNRRRGAKRRNSHNRQIMHLSHAQVGIMSFLQQRCFLEGKMAIILLSLITQLTMVYILVRHNSVDNAYEAMLLALLQLKFAKVKDCDKYFDCYQYVDYMLHDIPP